MARITERKVNLPHIIWLEIGALLGFALLLAIPLGIIIRVCILIYRKNH